MFVAYQTALDPEATAWTYVFPCVSTSELIDGPAVLVATTIALPAVVLVANDAEIPFAVCDDTLFVDCT